MALTGRDFCNSGIYPRHVTLCIRAQCNNSQNTDVCLLIKFSFQLVASLQIAVVDLYRTRSKFADTMQLKIEYLSR
jgi:hypothetical protein